MVCGEHSLVATIDGGESGGSSIGVDGHGSQLIEGNFSLGGDSGHTYSVTVDGQTIAAGVLANNNETGCPYNTPIELGNIPCNTPSPSPPPTASPSPTVSVSPAPTSSPPPSQGGTPPAGGGGTPPPIGNGGAATTRYGDVYADVRQALDDAGNQDTGTVVPDTSFDVGAQSEDVVNNRNWDNVLRNLTDTTGDIDNLTNTVQSNLDDSNSVHMPTVSGTVLIFDLGTISFIGRTLHPVINLTPFAEAIQLLRDLLLFVLYLQFWYWTIKIIQQAMAVG